MLGFLVRLLICAICACALCGCEQRSSPPASAKRAAPARAPNVLIWPLSAHVTNFDPIAVTSLPEATVIRQLFDNLVRLNNDLSLAPGIASKWEIDPTGREYTFHLKSGVFFHDGSPLTAADVKRSLERLARSGQKTFIYKHLKAIEGFETFSQGQAQDICGILVIGPSQVRIRLGRPHAPFLSALSIYQAAIVSVPNGPLQTGQPQRVVGSGPFVLESADEQRITMRPFQRFVDGAPRLDSLVFKIYAGADIKRAAEDFQAGELSAVPLVGPVKEMLPGNANYKVIRRNMIGLFFYGFNVRENAALTPAMRKRIAQVIDRRSVVTDIHKGLFPPTDVIIPLGLAGYRSAWTAPADGEERKAQPALPERILMLSVAHNDAVEAEMAYLDVRLRNLGCKLQVEYIPNWDEFYKRLAAGDCDMFRLSWYPDTPDLDEVFFPLFHSQGEYNYFGYSNPRVDALLEQARAMIRLEDRIKVYQQAEDILLSDLPVIPMWNEALDRAVKPTVHGLGMSSFGEIYNSFGHVWIE